MHCIYKHTLYIYVECEIVWPTDDVNACLWSGDIGCGFHALMVILFLLYSIAVSCIRTVLHHIEEHLLYYTVQSLILTTA